ncbi:hypothetical protein Tco_0064210 [Tanacetum coccineum]
MIVGSIWRIQGVGYGILEFLGVRTTFDIFQNLHILYFQYGVLVFSGYGVLIKFPLWSLKFKGKDIVDNAAQVSNATTIAPGMYKIDPVTLALKDKNNRETHIYYLKHTTEQAAILREIVEQVKSLNLLDSASYFACKYVKLIQELLGYVRDTCPGIHKPSKKLVAVTPINKKKTVRFVEPVISSQAPPKKTVSASSQTKTNRPLQSVHSTGVSQSTKSSRSKSIYNTKNDKILQISSRTQKMKKVDDHSNTLYR